MAMQAPSAAHLAPFQLQSAFQDHLPVDPFACFLDQSSIYPDIDLPLSLASFRSISGGHTHCDWSDPAFLLPPPLQYDYDTSPMPAPLLDTPRPTTVPATSSNTQSIRNACPKHFRASSSRTSKQEGAGPRPREKKHGCRMCEKSFDRPSTLRKHLLVHTGEKAFVCDTCGRRFGVASNLNRHVKRCILKPVNAANRAAQMNANTTSSPTALSADAPLLISTSTSSTSHSVQKRTREGNTGPASPPEPHKQSKPPAKRRRRAPSPSKWVPQSLADFSITPAEQTKPTPVPLPPVSAFKDPCSDESIEERNSWDENVSLLPYHPCGWKGTLPGPAVGLGGKDAMDLGLVNRGTYVMDRLVMV